MIDLTHYVATQTNKTFAVFGLARSGLSTIKALIHADAKVIAYDDNIEAQNKARALGAEITPLTESVLEQCASLILAPGVPLTHPEPHDVVKAAQAADTEIISDIELLYRAYPACTYVGITGTNGKSTTTALIDHILTANGLDSKCGGNIGIPVMELTPPDERGAFVLELSSYQLDLCDRFTADIAVLLNITPDHLDRHGGMEGYTVSKMRIFEGAKHKIKPENLTTYKNLLRCEGRNDLGPDFKTLPGEHNLENAAAALAVCRIMGVDDGQIIAAMKSFAGLPHRQFLVRTINGIQYVNDSKATNAEAASKALSSYDDIFLIAGGRIKDGGLKGIEAYLNRLHHVYLIGEATEDFSAFLTAHDVPHTKSGTLHNAINGAHEAAQAFIQTHPDKHPVVLLSPACASFDQFASYEHRGDDFVNIVKGL